MTGRLPKPVGRWRNPCVAALPSLTAVWVLFQLLSLRLGWLSGFFFDTSHADVQGVDYYSLPKAWLNLSAGRSLYGTFDPPAYGPHFTWYLSHPLLALTLGGPLSRLAPAESYGVFTLMSLGAMAASAYVLTRESNDPLGKRLIWLLLVGSFPGFAMLWVGNVQALTVLALSLLFTGLVRLAAGRSGFERFLLAGLLVSLFTKPVVALMFPCLLLLRETRRAASTAIAVYVPVSLLCEVMPWLNPQGVGLPRVFWLGGHPEYVRLHMNVYANHLVLTPDMRDNSVHWFNLVAQSSYRLQHIDVFSLPVFMDGLLGRRTPDWPYFLPTLAVLTLSWVAARMAKGEERREAVLVLMLATSLDFFLTYPTVWEYQYTAVLPVGAALVLMPASRLLSRRLRGVSLALVACVWLPSFYCLVSGDVSSAAILTMVRLDRVLPVTALFCLLVLAVTRSVLSGAKRMPSDFVPRRDYSLRAGNQA